MRIVKALSLYALPFLISSLSSLQLSTAVKVSRDVDWVSKTDVTPIVGTTLTRRATQEAAKSDPTTGQGVVTFLQVLQQANIKSQACWINLVNATQSEMGSCLQLDTLAQLLVQDPANSSFADSASTYLSAMCGQAQCSQQAIDAWKPAFDWDCGLAEDSGTPLVQALDMTLKLYTSAYRNLACDITFNGTSTNCLAEVLNSTAMTNNRDFFTNMISGMNIQWYDQSFFGVKWCTGCYYELYKAAMFLIPSIQGLEQMHWLGGNLTQCTEPANVKWGDVCDRAKPNSLIVTPNTNPGGTSTGGASSLSLPFGREGRLAPAIAFLVFVASVWATV